MGFNPPEWMLAPVRTFSVIIERISACFEMGWCLNLLDIRKGHTQHEHPAAGHIDGLFPTYNQSTSVLRNTEDAFACRPLL
jgi:hypothetical protein